jgi:hypothetical protein
VTYANVGAHCSVAELRAVSAPRGRGDSRAARNGDAADSDDKLGNARVEGDKIIGRIICPRRELNARIGKLGWRHLHDGYDVRGAANMATFQATIDVVVRLRPVPPRHHAIVVLPKIEMRRLIACHASRVMGIGTRCQGGRHGNKRQRCRPVENEAGSNQQDQKPAQAHQAEIYRIFEASPRRQRRCASGRLSNLSDRRRVCSVPLRERVRTRVYAYGMSANRQRAAHELFMSV